MGNEAVDTDLEDIEKKLEAFGWAVKSVDGHHLEEMITALKSLPFEAGKPSFLIANTVKGKGISYMEGVLKWHHGVPSDEQYQQAIEELDTQLANFEA